MKDQAPALGTSRRVAPALLGVVAVLASVAGCAGQTAAAPQGGGGCVQSFDANRDYFPDKVTAQHSKQWQAAYHNNYKVLRVKAGPKSGMTEGQGPARTYVLYQCGTPAPELTGELAGATAVSVPVGKVVDGEATLFGAFEAIDPGLLAAYGEFPSGGTQAEQLPGVAARLSGGAVEVGHGKRINLERVLQLDPDVMFAALGEQSTFDSLARGGVPVVFYDPFAESPLGAAEQVKFLSLFANAEQRANAHFAGVSDRYTRLAGTASGAQRRPTVLIGINSHGPGFMVPQNDYFEPVMVRDAGGRTAFDLPGRGLQRVAVETVIATAGTADFWFRPDFISMGATTAKILADDPKMGQIGALQAGRAFDRLDPRVYAAAGLANPDRVLADLVSIVHPDLMPGHRLTLLRRIG